MAGVYLAAILTSHVGIALLDARWKLAVWARPRPALVAIAALTVLFVAIDVLAITMGLYGLGNPRRCLGGTLPHISRWRNSFLLCSCPTCRWWGLGP